MSLLLGQPMEPPSARILKSYYEDVVLNSWVGTLIHRHGFEANLKAYCAASSFSRGMLGHSGQTGYVWLGPSDSWPWRHYSYHLLAGLRTYPQLQDVGSAGLVGIPRSHCLLDSGRDARDVKKWKSGNTL